jgi:hypothetical protein
MSPAAPACVLSSKPKGWASWAAVSPRAPAHVMASASEMLPGENTWLPAGPTANKVEGEAVGAAREAGLGLGRGPGEIRGQRPSAVGVAPSARFAGGTQQEQRGQEARHA